MIINNIINDLVAFIFSNIHSIKIKITKANQYYMNNLIIVKIFE